MIPRRLEIVGESPLPASEIPVGALMVHLHMDRFAQLLNLFDKVS